MARKTVILREFFFTDCTIFVVIDSCHLGHSKEEYAQEDSGEHITAEI